MEASSAETQRAGVSSVRRLWNSVRKNSPVLQGCDFHCTSRCSFHRNVPLAAVWIDRAPRDLSPFPVGLQGYTETLSSNVFDHAREAPLMNFASFSTRRLFAFQSFGCPTRRYRWGQENLGSEWPLLKIRSRLERPASELPEPTQSPFRRRIGLPPPHAAGRLPPSGFLTPSTV
jgi:hypothetical protein